MGEASKKTAKLSKSDFFTKEKAEKGVKIPLSLPTGEETEHWIKIISADSEAYKNVERDASRRLVKEFSGAKIDSKNESIFDDKANELQLEITASLVVDWSFEDEKCTKANVIDMLKNAPHIRTQIENIAINRKEVFYKLSAIS